MLQKAYPAYMPGQWKGLASIWLSRIYWWDSLWKFENMKIWRIWKLEKFQNLKNSKWPRHVISGIVLVWSLLSKTLVGVYCANLLSFQYKDSYLLSCHYLQCLWHSLATVLYTVSALPWTALYVYDIAADASPYKLPKQQVVACFCYLQTYTLLKGTLW